jgi:hypothetical protein
LASCLVIAAACSDSAEEARRKATTQASYDLTTGKLTEITYDKNKNGKIDTWTKMDGARPVSSELDTNEDGKIDRWETYNERGQLAKVEWERAPTPDAQGLTPPYTGKPNAVATMDADGNLQQIEYFETSDVTHEREVSRRETYQGTKLLKGEEDSDGDGLMDRWETFVDGVLTTVEFDEIKPYDGKPDRRITYSAAGAMVLIETDPDGQGGYRTKRIPGKQT